MTKTKSASGLRKRKPGLATIRSVDKLRPIEAMQGLFCVHSLAELGPKYVVDDDTTLEQVVHYLRNVSHGLTPARARTAWFVLAYIDRAISWGDEKSWLRIAEAAASLHRDDS